MVPFKVFCTVCAALLHTSSIVGEETTPIDVLDYINEDVTVHDRELTAVPLEVEFASVRTDVDRIESAEEIGATTISKSELLTEVLDATTVISETSDGLFAVEADLGGEDFDTVKYANVTEDELFKIITQDDPEDTDDDTDPVDNVYEGELFIEARRIDTPSRSKQRLPRPGIKVQYKKYQTVNKKYQSVSSEEEDEPKTIQEVKVTNMRIIGVSKDKVEEEPVSSSLSKPPSKPAVHEKLLVYKQKPTKKIDPKFEKKKTPYVKPIKIVVVDEDDSREESSVSTMEHSNMRIMGVPKEDSASEGPDLLASGTAHTRLPVKSGNDRDESNGQTPSHHESSPSLKEVTETVTSVDEVSPIVSSADKSISTDETSALITTTLINRIQELVHSQKNTFVKEASDDDKESSSVIEAGIESSGDGDELKLEKEKLETSPDDTKMPLIDVATGLDDDEPLNVHSGPNASEDVLNSLSLKSISTSTTSLPIISSTQHVNVDSSSESVLETTKPTRVTYPRPKFTKRPYLKLTPSTTSTTTESTIESVVSTSKKPIKRFSAQHLNFTRSATIHRRTQIFTPPSQQNTNDLLPLENFWDDDTIQKWKNIHQVYADYGKRELKLRILKDAKRLRHSIGDILHDFTTLTFPVNKERICRVRKVQILIIIFSPAENFAVRNNIRKTWVKDLNVTESDEVKYLFFLPENKLITEEIQLEQKNYGDLIQTDTSVRDHPVAFLKWISDYCPRALSVLKVDDDVFINVDNFFNSLKRITDMNAIYGVRSTHLVAERGENGVDEASWPWRTLPPYLQSPILLIGGEAVPKLYGAAQTLPRLNNEGLYLTSLCAQQAGVKRYIFKRFFSEKRDFNITSCAVEYLDAFRVATPDRFETIYEEVKKVKFESQKCFGTIDCVENLFGVCLSLHEIL